MKEHFFHDSKRKEWFVRNEVGVYAVSSLEIMNLRPPSFRFILALVGASLILWGAKGQVLNIPGLLEVNLFEMNRSAAWALVISALIAAGLAWLRPVVFAWLAWGFAVGSLAFLLKDLWSNVQMLSAGFEEMKAAGIPAPDLERLLKSTQIKPGAVSVVSGLLIQAVGLSLRRKPRV